ncbi:MAG TPA: SusC/RagA family TonB-linked outer membrane protein, partial [Segetibacter sp.]
MKKNLPVNLLPGYKLLCEGLRKVVFTLVFILFTWVSVYAQQRKITGKVTAEDATPLPGVSLAVKGGTAGTKTDANGMFSLDVPANATIEASAVGYTKQEIAVGDKTSIDIRMQVNTSEMDQVVVVGFGTQRKVNLTGSVSTVSAKALADRPVQNAVQALQGLVTGLNISQNNGSLESTPSINIRGTAGGLGTSSSSPLILIDGMEGSLSAINPQDIESISVLKDAAAAAVYGSRAAYGVMLVTTKRGKAGKTQFNYNNNFRSTRPVFLPKQMDSYTFALFFNDASINAGSAPFFNAEHLQRIKDYQSGKITASIIRDPNNPNRWADGYGYGNANVDWFRAMYKEQAFSQEHNVSVTGGNERTSYYLSGNYMPQSGFMKFNTDFYDRYGITAKINSKLTDQVSINYSARFIHENYQRPANLTNGFY